MEIHLYREQLGYYCLVFGPAYKELFRAVLLADSEAEALVLLSKELECKTSKDSDTTPPSKA